MASTRTVESIIDLWQDRYQRARAPGPAVDIRTNDEYLAKKNDLDCEFKVLFPLGERYVALVLGRLSGDTPVEISAAAALCFVRRFFDADSVDSLNNPASATLTEFVFDTFYLGLACEFALMNHPARARVAEVDQAQLFEEFLEASIVAKQKIGEFYKGAHGMPGDIFDAQYALIEPLLKNGFRVGFWKRGKLQANFENLYYAGALLSIMACLKATRG